MFKICALAIVLSMASSATAQDWPNESVPEMLVRTLSPTGAMEGGQWFVSSNQLVTGTKGLGIIYAHVPGSAGTVSIHAGLYNWTGNGWRAHKQIEGLYGSNPTNVQFGPTYAHLTTTTLGPEDPRCCPTAMTRWSIDLSTGTAIRQD